MTNEELYERITSMLKEQGVRISQFESKVKAETGKNPNLKMTKSRLSLPNTVAFPYLTTSLCILRFNRCLYRYSLLGSKLDNISSSKSNASPLSPTLSIFLRVSSCISSSLKNIVR